MNRWIICGKGRGYHSEDGVCDTRRTNFTVNAVGLVNEDKGDTVIVWLVGTNEIWCIASNEITDIDVKQTGDKFIDKICNVCHCMLPVNEFAINQRNKHGLIRRPSCKHCRTNIDKRAPKSMQAKQMAKKRPKKGDAFRCPICRKRSIVGITAKIVADHDHHTGNIRDFICDSCNTGLGRFKNGENYLRNALDYLKERDAL